MKTLFTVCFLGFSVCASAQQPVMVIHDMPENGEWEHFGRELNTYNSDDQLEVSYFEDYLPLTGEWQSATKMEVTYNSDGNVTEELTFSFVNQSEWVNNNRRTYTYNAQGNVQMQVAEIWNSADEWQGLVRFIYSYTGTTDDVAEILVESWNGTTWVNSRKRVYTNNASGTVEEVVISLWDAGTAAFVPEEKWNYTYDVEDNPQTEIVQTWQGGQWVNSTQSLYVYDTEDILTEIVTERWNTQDETYVNDTKTIYYLNPDGTMHQFVNEVWNVTASEWIGDYQATFYYEALGLESTGLPQAHVFPNPAQELLTVSFEQSAASTLTLTDASGKECAVAQKQSLSHTLSVGDLPAGVYYLQIVRDGQVETRKVVKG